MKNRIITFIKTNLTVILFVVFSILIEMISVYSIEESPFISYPWIWLGLLLLIAGIMLMIKSERARMVIGIIFMLLQSIICMIMAVLFNMAGQYFDFGMLNLRNDAFGILENIPMDFVTFYTAFFFCLVFGISTARRRRRAGNSPAETKKSVRLISGSAVMAAGLLLAVFATYNVNKDQKNKYEDLRYSTDSSVYNTYGICGNLINEFADGLIFTEDEIISDEKVNDFIYGEVSEPTEYFGVSKDNNVVVVLVESLEWFGMLKNDYLPNALPLTDEQYAELFPNLTAFYNSSVVMTDFHSKEKTDISETMSILGAYPTRGYINYDYYDQKIPQTIPNILRNLCDEELVINSYHNGSKTFYNRDVAHVSYGFTKFTSSEDMYEISDQMLRDGLVDKEVMHDYMHEGERNLDSEMLELCKERMFPENERFFTYITSITMHGMFYERANLAHHKEKLLSVYTDPAGTEEEELLINYLCTVMEFDKALGIMMDYLRDKGLLDHTTVILFGDHNCYYQDLSNYVKNIYDYDTEMNYSDLYRVPLMIYDEHAGHKVIDKFTCTADIAPSILDLLGIKYYSNMFYGHSVFSDEESVIYSRAYNFFVDDGIVAKSLSRPLFKADDVTDEDWNDFKEKGNTLIDKLEYCDQIFTRDFFSDPENYETFIEKMKEINADLTQ
ncbi:MAG: sulfatase-like hydrolase/transferase [Eubacterium sp.]|nr:sulfatase-like hydrolase/transferase [Eubacterium sp.]